MASMNIKNLILDMTKTNQINALVIVLKMVPRKSFKETGIWIITWLMVSAVTWTCGFKLMD